MSWGVPGSGGKKVSSSDIEDGTAFLTLYYNIPDEATVKSIAAANNMELKHSDEYGAYYELSYFTLTSKRYKITDESIIVSNDDEETIKDNLESSFDDIDYEIEGLTLRLTYDGQTIKEFTLDRTGDIKKSDDPLSDDEDPEIQNPKTGVFVSIIGIIISAIGAYVGLNYCRKNSKIRNV